MSEIRLQLLSFTGYPLSGKSTIAWRMAQHLRVPYMSTGQYIRQNRLNMVPRDGQPDLADCEDEVRGAVVRFLRLSVPNGGAVLDGFPRSIQQLEILQSLAVGSYILFFFMVSPDRQRARIGRPDRQENWQHILKRNSCVADFWQELAGFPDRSWFRFYVVDGNKHVESVFQYVRARCEQ